MATTAIVDRVRDRPVYVYFIRAGAHVKIGIANDIGRRLDELQTAHAAALEFECAFHARESDEFLVHARFSHLRERAEWFRREGDLESLIEALRAAGNSAMATAAAAVWFTANPGQSPGQGPELAPSRWRNSVIEQTAADST